MSTGLEIYSENGAAIFTADIVFCRVLGSFSVDGTDSSITDESIDNRPTFIVLAEIEDKNETECSKLPVFTTEGNTISWKYNSTDYNVADVIFKGKYYYGVLGGKT